MMSPTLTIEDLRKELDGARRAMEELSRQLEESPHDPAVSPAELLSLYREARRIADGYFTLLPPKSPTTTSCPHCGKPITISVR